MEINHVNQPSSVTNTCVTWNSIQKSVTPVKRGVNLLIDVNKAGTQSRVQSIYNIWYGMACQNIYKSSIHNMPQKQSLGRLKILITIKMFNE